MFAALLTASLAVTGALVWFGLRNLQQERDLARQRERERLETAVDALAAAVRGKLAEVGDRLSSWISTPDSPFPEQPGAVAVTYAYGQVKVAPHTGNLGLHDLITGGSRLLTAVGNYLPGTEAFGEGSAISRDGRQVAYAWYDSKLDRYELRVLSLNGDARPQRVFESKDVPFIWPRDWTPDDKAIVAELWKDHKSHPMDDICSIPAASATGFLAAISDRWMAAWKRRSGRRTDHACFS